MTITKKLIAATVAGLALAAPASIAHANGPHVNISEYHHVHRYETRAHVEATFGTTGRPISTDCPADLQPIPTFTCATRRYPTLYGRDYVQVTYQGFGVNSASFFLVEKHWVHR